MATHLHESYSIRQLAHNQKTPQVGNIVHLHTFLNDKVTHHCWKKAITFTYIAQYYEYSLWNEAINSQALPAESMSHSCIWIIIEIKSFTVFNTRSALFSVRKRMATGGLSWNVTFFFLNGKTENAKYLTKLSTTSDTNIHTASCSSAVLLLHPLKCTHP